MIKRITAFTLALILIALLLCGCGKVDAPEDGRGKRFMTVCEDYDFEIVVDTETGVEYAVSRGVYNHGTFTLLVDSYGNPYLYPAFDAREDRPPTG